MPLVDIAVTVRGMPSIPQPFQLVEITTPLAAILATSCLWAALFLATRLVLRAINGIDSAFARVTATMLVGAAATAVVLYHLLIWSFVVMNGHLPSPDVIVFVLDNLARVPQHVLQTAPMLAVAAVVASALTAGAMLRQIAISDRSTPSQTFARQVTYIATLLAIWHVGGSAAPLAAPGSTLLGREPGRIEEARLRLQLESLPRRDQSAGTAPDRPLQVPVIVILVESLRHDLLHSNPEAVPFIKSMYESHTGFSRAYATASHSNLSDLAFWYSQYPLRGNGMEGFPVDAPWRGESLFDIFKTHGYKTAYISSQNERWGGMLNWLQTHAVDYFFHSESFEGNTWENFDDSAGLGGMIKRGLAQAGKVEDSATLEVARNWIDTLQEGEPFFLGMNLQNTHFSYVLTPGASQPYQPSDLGFRAVYYRWPEAKSSTVRNRYLNSVLNVDQLLGGFADYLRSRGLWDRALVVVLGDNGEAFYEHGFGNHSGPMYDEVVRTLAFLKPPAGMQLPVGTGERPVSHIDIAATIPDLVGIPRPWSFQGRSLANQDCAERDIFMYSNALVRQYGIVSWPLKLLITEFPTRSEELFDLTSDPEERTNLVEARPADTRRLRQALSNWIDLQRKYYREAAYVERIPPHFCLETLSGGHQGRLQLTGM
jgi:arylsulfatase A-like enzyme